MMKPSSRAALVLNLSAKVLLVALLVYALTMLDLPRMAGKAMLTRALLYPLSAVLVPVFWALRGRRAPYPHVADALLVSPFIVDVAGNVANLYNTFVWFDDAAHTITWMLLVLGVGSLILRLGLPPVNTAALCIGFGSVTHVLWEIIEFLLMKYGAAGLQLTYEDTIGDLALSLSGSVVAGLATGWRARKNPRR